MNENQEMASFSAQIRAFCPQSGSPASGSPALQVVTAGSGPWDLRAPDMNGCAGWIECQHTLPPCFRGKPELMGEAPQTRRESDVQQCLCDPLRRGTVEAGEKPWLGKVAVAPVSRSQGNGNLEFPDKDNTRPRLKKPTHPHSFTPKPHA